MLAISNMKKNASEGNAGKQIINQTEDSGRLNKKNEKLGISLGQKNVDRCNLSRDSLVEELMSTLSLQRTLYRAENELYVSDYKRVLEILKQTAKTEEDIALKKREIEEIRLKSHEIGQ